MTTAVIVDIIRTPSGKGKPGGALSIARTALLAAGFPESVPGTTVDRQCGSSQQAAHFAAQGVATQNEIIPVRLPAPGASPRSPGTSPPEAHHRSPTAPRRRWS
jgi:acetyl-CoA acyltransferase